MALRDTGAVEVEAVQLRLMDLFSVAVAVLLASMPLRKSAALLSMAVRAQALIQPTLQMA